MLRAPGDLAMNGRLPSIAVVGGGYAGLSALGRLLVLLPGAPLSLIEPSPVHLERARLHRALVGEPVAWKLERVLPRAVRWIRDRAKAIDGRGVILRGGERIDADFVIVAAGAKPRRGPAGALPIYGLEGIRKVRRRLAEADGAPVSIVGAGLTGVEIACALAGRLGERGRVRLVDRNPTLLPSLPERVRRTVLAALEELGVELELGSGKQPAGLVLGATGVEPAPIPGEGPNVLRVGDADRDSPLRCAQIARQQGMRAAAEIARRSGVETPLPEVELAGQVIDLGRAGWTGWINVGGLRLPIAKQVAAVGAEAVAVRHRAFLRTLPWLGRSHIV